MSTELCDYTLILEGRGLVDENGITYYNNLINELKANGTFQNVNMCIIIQF